ncbi:MAG TPA: acyl-[ACP]--phospholipid O-acyltransferase [Verrucomicrobia bacterium]|nr:MAG: 2-acyl-glycerophospho-ethanolamine acyltransferase [Lentisphaerae bacterium GWF2_57_35]HBA82568.1 acyl-[ACP]--phospholipid O-acyltransferase [Verrucomicrobiota bacterium]
MNTNPATELKMPPSFKWLNVVQFLGALNDNIFKLFLMFFLIALQGPEAAARISSLAGAIFVIPFLLFTALGGNLADRLSKRNIIVVAKLAEVVIMLLGSAAFAAHSVAGLYAVLFLMSVQSALFGPSKMGVIPELVGRARLSQANSILVTFTFIAIVLGSASAPMLGELTGKIYPVAQWFCVGIAVLGSLAAFGIEKTPPSGSLQKSSVFFLRDIYRTLRFVRKDSYLFMAVIAAAYFLLIGAFLQMNIIPYGMQRLGLTQEQSGYLFFVAAIGIAVGSWLAGRLSGRNIEFGIVPLGSLALTLAIVLLKVVPSHAVAVAPLMLLAGLGSGLFIVPLDAFIQFRSPHQRLGEILAASNFLSWTGVLIASGLVALFPLLGINPADGFVFMGALTLALTLATFIILPDFFIRFVILVITRLAYRISVKGIENVPVEGPALLICNHASYVDALLLGATQQRRIRFMMAADVYERLRFLQPLFRLMGCIPISTSGSPKKIVLALQQARAVMDDGYLVCIFAEGMLTRTGTLREFRRGFERIVKGADYPIVPVYLGGAWGSIASYYHGQLVRHWPALLRYPVSVIFGKPLPATATATQVKEAVMELSCEYFNDRKPFRRPLGEEFVRAARKRWFAPAMNDTTGRKLTYGKTLISSLALAQAIKRRLPNSSSLGIALPPSTGGVLANMAVLFAGGTPIHLNFTASAQSFESAIRQSEIKTLISARAFLERIPVQPEGVETICLEDLAASITSDDKRTALLQALITPARRLARPHGFQADDVATVLFSSGSTGTPKGIMLSHHNILSNIEALRMVFYQSPKDNLCAALPFFHSLGFTGCLWYPLLSGVPVTYHFNPLDGARMAQAVRENESTMLFATPTFLSIYLRKATPEDFKTLKYVVVGAEKMKPGLAEEFEKRFGVHPLEGYGATELSPVAALSIPHVTIGGMTQTGWKEGSVGMPLPGIAVRIVHPETGAILPPGEAGLLLIKGPNVMLGYLNQPEKTAEVLKEGWYNTGDMARVDEEGFLVITDRLSRFSKIGGEMIPHLAAEEELHKGLGKTSPVLAVTAVPDEKRGEKLVVLYTPEAGPVEKLHEILTASSLPNLWKPDPRCFFPIEQLPQLGSGKLDLAALKTMAAEKVAPYA